MIVTVDPSLVYCLCKKGGNSDFIEVSKLCLDPHMHADISGQGLARCRANNTRTATVLNSTLKFLD